MSFQINFQCFIINFFSENLKCHNIGMQVLKFDMQISATELIIKSSFDNHNNFYMYCRKMQLLPIYKVLLHPVYRKSVCVARSPKHHYYKFWSHFSISAFETTKAMIGSLFNSRSTLNPYQYNLLEKCRYSYFLWLQAVFILQHNYNWIGISDSVSVLFPLLSYLCTFGFLEIEKKFCTIFLLYFLFIKVWGLWMTCNICSDTAAYWNIFFHISDESYES